MVVDLAEGMEATTADRMAGAIMEVAMAVDTMAEYLVAGMVEVIMEVDMAADIMVGVMGEDIMEENITIMAEGIIMSFTDITHIITHSPTMDITPTPMIMDTIQPHPRME